jgi:hypothetical protein
VSPPGPARTVEQKRARAALVTNLVILPGLGSLANRRWVEGIGQLALAGIGSVLICIWLFGVITAVFTTLVPTWGGPYARAGLLGLGLLVLAWAWSGWTGYQLWRGAGGQRQ